MQTPNTSSSTTNPTVSNTVADDVLHLGSQTKLSPEEIAKAIAHHNKHHHGDQPQQAAAKVEAAKKRK